VVGICGLEQLGGAGKEHLNALYQETTRQSAAPRVFAAFGSMAVGMTIQVQPVLKLNFPARPKAAAPKPFLGVFCLAPRAGRAPQVMALA
jgi:hypothetical protein